MDQEVQGAADPVREAGATDKELLADALRKYPSWGHAYIATLKRVEQLEDALNLAGDRLMQVQPAIDDDCTWALGIVPQAQDEIAAALDGDPPTTEPATEED